MLHTSWLKFKTSLSLYVYATCIYIYIIQENIGYLNVHYHVFLIKEKLDMTNISHIKTKKPYYTNFALSSKMSTSLKK